MIRKVDGVDDLEVPGSTRGPYSTSSVTHVDIITQTLQRKYSGLAPYVSVGDMGLYAEDPLVHDNTRKDKARVGAPGS